MCSLRLEKNFLTIGHVRFRLENSYLAIERVRFASKIIFVLSNRCSLRFDIEENTNIEAFVRFRFDSVAITNQYIAIFYQENKNQISSCKFCSILDHQTLDPDPESGSAIRKNYGSGSVSGSALNQCRSETLDQRPNSWTKSRQMSSEFSSLLFPVTSPSLACDFYFSHTQPLTVSRGKLLYEHSGFNEHSFFVAICGYVQYTLRKYYPVYSKSEICDVRPKSTTINKYKVERYINVVIINLLLFLLVIQTTCSPSPIWPLLSLPF
jgi:hypothetical protein